MEQDCRNIYKSCRVTAGLTQERWAEVLGISPDSIRKYETGVIVPSDDVVLAMAEVSGQTVLGYWHLVNKSRVAGRILPNLCRRTLAEATLNLLNKTDDFTRRGLEDLKRLAADGKITAEEVVAYGEALAQLREVIAAAYELEYAEEGRV
jgi:transcriptional regulator with XRE-family HTH domain